MGSPALRCPQLAPEATFRLSEDTYLEPDLVVFETASGFADRKGENALLVVEVSDSSLRFDPGREAKARLPLIDRFIAFASQNEMLETRRGLGSIRCSSNVLRAFVTGT